MTDLTDFDALSHLKSWVVKNGSAFDIGYVGLALSESSQGVSLEKYEIHLDHLVRAVGDRFDALLAGGGDDDARTRLAALKHVLSDTFDYRSDHPNAEVLDTADIARVIETRKGNSTSISILYVRTARALGWDADVLCFPIYALCRLCHGPQRLVFDASSQCRIMAAPDLRALLKKLIGPNAELSVSYFEPLNPRALIIRLHNLIKLRYIEMGDYQKAYGAVDKMLVIDPQEYRLMLDAGVLLGRLKKPAEAIAALDGYLRVAPAGRDRQEAQQLLQELKAEIIF